MRNRKGQDKNIDRYFSGSIYRIFSGLFGIFLIVVGIVVLFIGVVTPILKLIFGVIIILLGAESAWAAVLAAYDAPFPDESYKESALQFPMLVPATPDDPATPANRKAWESLMRFKKPFLTAFSDNDPITAAGAPVLRKLIPGCEGQAHTTIENGGHFLQEDQGERLAEVVVEFIQANP